MRDVIELEPTSGSTNNLFGPTYNFHLAAGERAPLRPTRKPPGARSLAQKSISPSGGRNRRPGALGWRLVGTNANQSRRPASPRLSWRPARWSEINWRHQVRASLPPAAKATLLNWRPARMARGERAHYSADKSKGSRPWTGLRPQCHAPERLAANEPSGSRKASSTKERPRNQRTCPGAPAQADRPPIGQLAAAAAKTNNQRRPGSLYCSLGSWPRGRLRPAANSIDCLKGAPWPASRDQLEPAPFEGGTGGKGGRFNFVKVACQFRLARAAAGRRTGQLGRASFNVDFPTSPAASRRPADSWPASRQA